MSFLRCTFVAPVRLLICVAIGTSLLSPAVAKTFTMKDGSVITGELKSLSGGIYDVQTTYGPVKLPATSVLGIMQTQARSAGLAAQRARSEPAVRRVDYDW